MCGLSKFNPLNLRHGLAHTIATTPILNKVLPIVATAINPALGAAVTAAESYGGGNKVLPSLLSGATSFAGNAIGNEIGSSVFPTTIGSALSSNAGNATDKLLNFGAGDLGSNFANSIGNNLANQSIGGALGGLATNAAIGGGVLPAVQKQNDLNPNSLLPAPYAPKQAPQLQLPGSLSGLQGLSPDQQISNLATQGVYGGGNGPQEQSYFANLVNNQLVDKSGNVSPISNVNPIENSYLSQLGLGGYSNSKDLLGAISKWQSQQQGTSSTT